MNILIQILTLIAQIASTTTQAGTILSIIKTLEEIISTGVDEIKAVYQPIKNIIAVLKSNNNVTPEQMAQLHELDKATDDAFETAAIAAGASVDPNKPDKP